MERAAADGRRLLVPSADDRGLARIPRHQLAEGEREVAYYRAGYDGEVHYLDEYVGRLLAGVAERGLARTTIVAFTIPGLSFLRGRPVVRSAAS